MFIAANWKMNLDKAKIYDFVKGLDDFKFDENVKDDNCNIARFYITSPEEREEQVQLKMGDKIINI
jgi:triosephosphate isomerase